MTVKTNFAAYAVTNSKEHLAPFSYTPEPLGPEDVEIKIAYCGICHSDIHMIDNDWKISNYPLVPGHEIIGEVIALGNQVKGLQKGDRVGVGWQRSSCATCEFCRQGEENLCPKEEDTIVNHHGGFASHIRTNSRLCFPIPKSLPSDGTAPLLCGGATVFSPLIQHNIGATHKVAVMGVGGLGHLALQFASKFGCELTAISSSPHKREEALGFGANHFVIVKEPKDLEPLVSQFDFILVSTVSNLPWEHLLQILRPKGNLCLVGIPEEPVHAQVMSLVDGRKTISGSNIASGPVIRQMLDFAALHKIQAQIELFDLANVNQAIEKIRNNSIRYRAVLKMP